MRGLRANFLKKRGLTTGTAPEAHLHAAVLSDWQSAIGQSREGVIRLANTGTPVSVLARD